MARLTLRLSPSDATSLGLPQRQTREGRNSHDRVARGRFQNLHEFVTQARTNLNRNTWDHLIGGSETETTLARNRAALDAWGFRPRVLRDVSNVDCSRTFFGKKLRIPVLCSAVGSLQEFDPGGGATVAEATSTFGNGMILSSAAHPGLETKEIPMMRCPTMSGTVTRRRLGLKDIFLRSSLEILSQPPEGAARSP
jgi:isopentenyl diphosphate isomerase/L-lactate dehydrogenase-like FMN-dependent dehydrogenase